MGGERRFEAEGAKIWNGILLGEIDLNWTEVMDATLPAFLLCVVIQSAVAGDENSQGDLQPLTAAQLAYILVPTVLAIFVSIYVFRLTRRSRLQANLDADLTGRGGKPNVLLRSISSQSKMGIILHEAGRSSVQLAEIDEGDEEQDHYSKMTETEL